MLKKLKQRISGIFQTDSIPEAISLFAILAAGIISGIAAVIGWILFTVEGGYTTQINIVRERGIFAFEEMFTKGTVDIFYGSIVTVILVIALLVATIACLVCFYMDVKIIRRIIMSVLITLAAGIAGMVVYLDLLGKGKIPITEEQAAAFLAFIQRLRMEDISSLSMILLAIDGIMIVFAFIFIAVSKAGWILMHILQLVCLCFGVFPLLLLFLENIIPLFLLVITLALVLVAVFVGSKIVAGGVEDSRAGGVTGNSGRSESGRQKAAVPQRTNVQIVRVDSSCKVFRGETFANGKAIFSYNGFATCRLCSQNDYDKGKVRIVDNGTGDKRDHSPILPVPPQGASPI